MDVSLNKYTESVKKSTFLITVSGYDSPGITSEITGVLASYKVHVLDIAQAVIQKLLSLSLLFDIESDQEVSQKKEMIIKDLLFKANALGLKLDYQEVDRKQISQASSHFEKPIHYAVTLIADCVTTRALYEVTKCLAEWKMNIDVIKRLSEGEFSCVEMLVSSAKELNTSELRKKLLIIAKEQAVDIALQAEGLYRRAKRLVVLDIDSTLIQSEVIDELAREKGVYDTVSKITHEAMMGKINFDESLRRRCESLKGLSVDTLEKVYKKIQLTPGASDLIHVLKKLGYKIAVISGGFTFVADRLKESLGIDFAYANTLEINEGVLTGKVLPPIVNAQRKADLLDVIAQQEKIELDQVIAIGDGANDLPMLEKAGLGIAFNAKLVVREQADLSLSQKNMRSILYLLGLSAKDVSAVISPRIN